MANEDDPQGYPEEVIQRMYAEREMPVDSFRRPRKPISGYPFSAFDERVNSMIRNILFKRIKSADARRAGKRRDSDSE